MLNSSNSIRLNAQLTKFYASAGDPCTTVANESKTRQIDDDRGSCSATVRRPRRFSLPAKPWHRSDEKMLVSVATNFVGQSYVGTTYPIARKQGFEWPCHEPLEPEWPASRSVSERFECRAMPYLNRAIGYAAVSVEQVSDMKNVLRLYQQQTSSAQEIVDAIEYALLFPQRLDFSACHADAISKLPIAVCCGLVKAFTDYARHLILPRGMKMVPIWVNQLSQLSKLEINDYQAQVLDLTQSTPSIQRYSLYVSGAHLRELHVYTGTNVYYCGPYKTITLDLSANKIRVYHYAHDKTAVQSRTILGPPYLAADPESKNILEDNLNQVASFSDKDMLISCYHLAYYWVICRQRSNLSRGASSAHFVEKLKQHLGTPEKITNAIPSEIENHSLVALRYSTQNNLIGASHWGKFMQLQFAKMDVPGIQHWLVDSGTHMMAAELKTQLTDEREVQYIALFYDPNLTLTYARCVEQNFKAIADWSPNTFMPKESINYYWHDQPISHWMFLPDDLHYSLSSVSQPSFDKFRARVVEVLVSSDERRSPTLAWHLFAKGLPLHVLRDQLLQCTPEERMMWLCAKNSQYVPALFIAFQEGFTHTIAEFADILQITIEKKEMSSAEIEEILSAKNPNGVPGFYMAMQRGYTDVVIAFGGLVKRLLKQQHLNEQQAIELLQARRSNGVSGLQVALKNGYRETVAAFYKIEQDLGISLICTARTTN